MPTKAQLQAKVALMERAVNAKKRSKAKAIIKSAGHRGVSIAGKGDYATFAPGPGAKYGLFKRTNDWTGNLGAQIGGKLGGLPGKFLGGAAHALFKGVTGFGDYSIKENSLITGMDPPLFNNKMRTTRVTHREYLGDITGSTSFALSSYKINAGLVSSFPWLAQIAANYEQYRFRGLVFEFKSMSSDALNSTNTALGTVIMATEYNSVNPNFSSKAAMENHEFSTACRPSQSFYHPIECNRNETTLPLLYTRSGSVPTGADPRMYDLGNFQIATAGMQASAVIGEIWCTYDVELYKPQLFQSLGQGCVGDHYRFQTLGSGITSSGYFGDVAYPGTLQPGSNAGTALNYSTSTINFFLSPVDMYYWVMYQATGTSAVLTNALAISGGGGISTVSVWKGGTTAQIQQAAGVTNTMQFIVALIKVQGAATGATRQLTITAGTLPTSVTSADLFVVQNNSALLSKFMEQKAVAMASGCVTTSELSKALALESKEPRPDNICIEEEGDEVDDAEYQAFLAFKAGRAASEDNMALLRKAGDMLIANGMPAAGPTPPGRASSSLKGSKSVA